MNKFAAARLFALLCLSFSIIYTHAQVTTPRVPSPAANVTQTVGISTVNINYSRPSVKGREVWGKLVPYGWNAQAFGLGNSAPWRAGANENTVITFSHPVKVEGKDVPAGSYGLFFVINADNTGEVVLSKDHQSWGSFFYIASNDELRAPIRVRDNNMTETLTYDFRDVTKNTAELDLNWEKKTFPVKIEFATDEIVMNNAKEELKGAKSFNFVGPASAANYSLQNKVNLDQGLIWANQALAQNPSFGMVTMKANILKARGDSVASEHLIDSAIAAANENDLNNYGYNLLLGGQVDKAIKVFTINTQKNPKSPNVWDSLGEGYATKGDKKNAIINFKKALSLNPPANVRANSEKFLKQLGAM